MNYKEECIKTMNEGYAKWRKEFGDKQRTGTFLCCIFGHKFIGKKITKNRSGGIFEPSSTIEEPCSTNCCVRCGKDKS